MGPGDGRGVGVDHHEVVIRNGGGVNTNGQDFFGPLVGTTNLTNCIVSGNRATSNGGKVQPDKPGWNPPGYMRNVVESVAIRVV